MAIGVIFVNLLSLWLVVLPNSSTFVHLAVPDQKRNASACHKDRTALGEVTKKRPSRIQYKLIHEKSYWPLYSRFSCVEVPNASVSLPTELQGRGVVDFWTEVSTDLKVAVVGDSVGMQIAQIFEEALGSDPLHRTVYEQSHLQNLVVSYPVRGGGTFISFRVNGMLWRDLEVGWRRRPLSQRRRQLKVVLQPQPWNRSKILNVLSRPLVPIQSVDVLVQRVTFPWTPLRNITHQSLASNTRVASEVFGMRTLIYVNMHFCNNVADPTIYREFLEKREVVRSFARTYVPKPSDTVRRVLVLDLDDFVDRLNECNARSLGFDTENTPFEEWMMGSWKGPLANDTSEEKAVEQARLPQHRFIGQVCGERVPHGSEYCLRNLIFVDGMHICANTFAGRMNAGLACLIACAEADEREEVNQQLGSLVRKHGRSELRACERRCNNRFMSLRPIPEHEMVRWNETSSRIK
jgi:hypothetical protein